MVSRGEFTTSIRLGDTVAVVRLSPGPTSPPAEPDCLFLREVGVVGVREAALRELGRFVVVGDGEVAELKLDGDSGRRGDDLS